MALTKASYFANVTLVDSSGKNKSTLRYKLNAADGTDPDGTAFITALANAQTLRGHLEVITDAVVKSLDVGLIYEEDTNFTAAEGVQVENVALVSARIFDPTEKWAQLRIPAPNIGIFLTATGSMSNVVDNTDASLRLYLGDFTLAGVATISDGETLAAPTDPANVKGKRIHRGSRNG